MISRRFLLAGAAAAPVLGLVSPAAAQVRAHAFEDFFREPEARDAALSPAGDRIALLVHRPFGDKPATSLLLILDAADPTKALQTVVLDFEARAVEWANDDRLLVWMLIRRKVALEAAVGSRLGGEQATITFHRVLSISRDGSQPVALFERESTLQRHATNLATIVDLLPDDPEHVLMLAWHMAQDRPALFKVNVNTGDARAVEMGAASTVGWGVKDGAAVVRRDLNARGTVETWFARAPGETGWKRVRRTRVDQRPDFTFLSAGDRPGSVIVAARLQGEDTVSVRELDLQTLQFGAPLSQRPGHDAEAALFDERGRRLAVRYTDDRMTYDFAEKDLAAHFKGINSFFENEANVRLYDTNEAHTRFLAVVTGPREPGAFYYYDKAAARLENLGAAMPKLERDRLGVTRPLKVKTRDGAEIPAYLTAPPGGARGPLVVLVHGGPEHRDSLDWNREVQVLAARGWWVLQPNFRGSGGFGEAFVAAGRRRWGDRMQEDVEDAVAQVVASGSVDPGRVAIMGASYGGYAALMGAVRRPELYKAVVALLAVTDLPEFLATERRLESTDPGAYDYWVKTMGDPETDRAALEAASPRRRAAEIQAPVLLIHGVDDLVVPVEQSRIMAKALKAAGKRHELIEVEKAGHGDWTLEKDKELTGRAVAFIAAAFKA